MCVKAIRERNLELVANINRIFHALEKADPLNPLLLEIPTHSLAIIQKQERIKCAEFCKGVAEGCYIENNQEGGGSAIDCADGIEALS